jgi:hypothetical protein
MRQNFLRAGNTGTSCLQNAELRKFIWFGFLGPGGREQNIEDLLIYLLKLTAETANYKIIHC